MNVKLYAIAAAVLVVVLIVGGVYASQRAQINALRNELSRTVTVIEQRDKERALREGEFTRTLQTTIATFTETVKAMKTAGGGTVVIRETTRPASPPPRPGSTTPPPPQTGKPLIPAEKIEDARTVASERIRVDLDEGSLVGCIAPGLGPDQIELLRDATGRLLSPNPCVARISDQVNLRESPTIELRREPSRWKVVAGGSSLGFDYGAAYEVVRVRTPLVGWKFSGDAAALIRTQSLGPGVSYGFRDGWTVGPYYMHSFSEGKQIPWILFGKNL